MRTHPVRVSAVTDESPMNAIEFHIQICQFNRTRTLALLDAIEQMPDPQAVLNWRPGPGRAPIGWHFMHIGITEELFATDRLAKKPGAFTDFWPRFRGGSTPDDNVPPPQEIRQVLEQSRDHLLQTLSELDIDKLDDLPPHWKERGLPLRTVLHIIAWHEPHHHGQAHGALNLYKALAPAEA